MLDQNQNPKPNITHLFIRHQRTAVLAALMLVAHLLMLGIIWFSPEINSAFGYETSASIADVAPRSATSPTYPAHTQREAAPAFLSAF